MRVAGLLLCHALDANLRDARTVVVGAAGQLEALGSLAGLDIIALWGSQGEMSHLDSDFDHALEAKGATVRKVAMPAVCLTAHMFNDTAYDPDGTKLMWHMADGEPRADGCRAKSSVDLITTACEERPAQVIVMMQSLNDLKAVQHYGEHLGADLETWYRSAKQSCGDHVKVVLVQPPLGTLVGGVKADSKEWPHAELEHIRGNQRTAFAALVAAHPEARLVNGTEYEGPAADFDRPAHFCCDPPRDCQTKTALLTAITAAVEEAVQG